MPFRVMRNGFVIWVGATFRLLIPLLSFQSSPMSGRFGFVLILAAGAIASGCRCVKTCVEHPFPGLRTNLVQTSVNGGTLRLLIVHGMTTHTQGYSSNFVDLVARNLALSCREKSMTSLTNAAGLTNGFLG